MTVFRRIDNLDLLCSDLDRLVEFYHEVLGLPFFLPYDKDLGWAALDAGNLTMYIFATDNSVRQPRRTPVNEENQPSWDSIAFETENLDAAIAKLDGKVEWAGNVIRWEHPSGTWYRYRPMYDPEDNMLYVTEPHKIHLDASSLGPLAGS
jgi:isopenicillin-N N-acyltransferase-like protein